MNPPIELTVVHETALVYTAAVVQAHHLGYLRPWEDAYQTVEQFELAISPNPSHHTNDRDQYGNARVFFSLYQPHRALNVRSSSVVRITPRFAEIDTAAGPAWETAAEALRYVIDSPWVPETEFVFASPYVPIHQELRAYALQSFTPGRAVMPAALDLMHRIHMDFRYETTTTDIATPVLEAFSQRSGVCQDFAHVLIGCMRALGLSARYVSGYLLTSPPPGRRRLLGADASHAWVSIHCPSIAQNGGWIDLDPTNDVIPSSSHVTLAIGRDYGDVAPLRGVIRGGGEHKLKVGVSVAPLNEQA